jgi:transmembrane sensor
MGNEKAEELIRKYLEGTATPEEEALLDSWYMEMARQQPDMPPVSDYPKIGAEIAQALQTEQTAQQDQPKTTRTIRLWPRITAAAAVIIVLSIGSYLLIHKEPPPPVVQRPVSEHDILPAGTKATLTLLDGQTLPIDSTNNNALARQKNTTVSTANGQLIYSPGTPAQATQETYNTLTTRPGEHYSLSLPDGTLAWLNAASSITYPVAFEANVRKVKVTGEVYFQIAHDAKQPFQIEVKDQLIEDIGTRLNINAYDDEPAIYTTLLEGSIKLTKGSASLILKPGEEAADSAGNPSFQVKTVDADAAIAWKNGYFDFNRADIQTVMRELARWYGVQVVYKGTLPKKIFKGKVYRNINASEALQILSYFGAHFEIRDTTITVTF